MSEPRLSGDQITPDSTSTDIDSIEQSAKATGYSFEYCGYYIHAVIWWDVHVFNCNVYRRGHLNKTFTRDSLHDLLSDIRDHFGVE